MKLAPMAVRGGKRVQKTLLGGGHGAMRATKGGQGSDSKHAEAEEDSVDEIDTDDEGETKAGQPTITKNSESISQAVRLAVNSSRRASLKLAEAEYEAPDGGAELARARMRALEILESSARASAAVADAVTAPKAVQGGGGAPGQAGSAAAAAAAPAPAVRVRTGGPGRQAQKPFSRGSDSGASVVAGPGGERERGKESSATTPGMESVHG